MTTLDTQYDALTQKVGLARLDDRMVVRVTGDDRVAFMHGMCSQDIQHLQPGMAAPALVLTEHAHVVADFFIYATGEALLIDIERALWTRTRAHLEQFLVADDVEFEELDDLVVIDVEGPLAPQALAAIDGEVARALKEWRHIIAGSTRIALIPRFGVPAYTLLAAASAAAHLVELLFHATPGAQLIASSTLDLLRIEHGLARVGVDSMDKTLALEARLERAISFNKGCYIGQETIERATARGGIKKRLCSLLIEGEQVPPVNSPVLLDGKEVGRLTSVLRSPHLGIVALGMLHHSAWEKSLALTITHGEHALPATVRA